MAHPNVVSGRRWRYVVLGNWALVDQALSSGTNFLLALLVVRSVSAADFGAFSIVALLYVIGLGISRALTAEPLTIRFGRAADPIRERAPGCFGLALGVGIAFGGCCLAAAAATSGTLQSVLIVLGLTLPLLVVQDAGRTICFAMNLPRRAAANDALWALLQLPLVVAVLVEDDAPTWHYVVAWLVPGAFAGLFMLYQLHVRPSIQQAGAWFTDNRRLAIPLVWNYFLTAAPPYLLFALTPLVASLYELGIARAAYLPYGLFGVVFQSAWLVLLPAASRRSHDEINRLAVWSSAGLGAVALLWSAIVVLAIPDALGEALFGSTWADASGPRVAFGVALVAQALGIGPLVALRALEAPKSLVHVRLVTSPLLLVGGLVLAAEFGAIGVALAVAFGDVSTTLLSWGVLARLRRHLDAAPGRDEEPALPAGSGAALALQHETVVC
jgi:hypothetical protein